MLQRKMNISKDDAFRKMAGSRRILQEFRVARTPSGNAGIMHVLLNRKISRKPAIAFRPRHRRRYYRGTDPTGHKILPTLDTKVDERDVQTTTGQMGLHPKTGRAPKTNWWILNIYRPSFVTPEFA